MALEDTIRAGVASAKAAIDSLLVDVTRQPFVSKDGDGKPTYGTSVTLRGFVEEKNAALAWRIGREIVEAHLITFPENVTVNHEDLLTFNGKTLPVLEVNGPVDPAGGRYLTQVICGRPERGVTVV